MLGDGHVTFTEKIADKVLRNAFPQPIPTFKHYYQKRHVTAFSRHVIYWTR